MKVLITGGAGFIGSWVADAFLDRGDEVLIIDNLSTGREGNIPENSSFVNADIRDVDKIEGVFSDFIPDLVDHHAAQVDVRKSVGDPVYDCQVNIQGTLNLLELSARYSVNRFIFASTGGAIYGEPERIPADETTAPMPISPYGISKYAVEKYLYYYKSVYDLDYVSLRYANVYGPRQNPHGEAGVVAIFCNRIIADRVCHIFGDGKQTRDYVFVQDVARANILSLDAPVGKYNIGTGVETSVNELVDSLKKVSKRDVGAEHVASRPEEVQNISLDSSLARKILGWTPKIDLETGLNKTWKWFLENE